MQGAFCHICSVHFLLCVECHDYITRLDVSILEQIDENFTTRASTVVSPEFEKLAAAILHKYYGVVGPLMATNYEHCLYKYFILKLELNELFHE